MNPETPPDWFESQLFKTCSILESIANQYDPGSVEHLAVRDAAQALILVSQRKSLKSAYEQLKSAAGPELTPAMIEQLKSMGIDPHEMDDDDF